MLIIRRTNLEVSVDILEAARNGAKKTRIVYQSNLNFEIVKTYLNTLISSGLLAENEKGYYVTTQKGIKFVEDYGSLVKPLSL